ncbi:IPT/TIG domain-containing protein [Spirosoma lituiforme]
MKYVKQFSTGLLLLVALMVIIASCKKAPVDDPTPQPATTAITTISPATAPVGSTIVITGTNFSTDPASNTVTIGGVTATVVSASSTQLVVVVPTGAASGPVSVTAGGQTAQSQATFTVAIPSLKPVKEVQGTIFANVTWSKDTVYQLRGMVYIPQNYTLTIGAGTVIKGSGPELDPQGTSMAGTLVIERRGAIRAQGTAAAPIVFTSAKAAGQRAPGDWGGLVLVGKSPINKAGTTANPNGVRGTVETYGEPADNSGTLQYVRIEYAGAVQPTSPATRLAGLTLIGVGTGTTIDHIQVSYSGSDAFSWFGGTARAKNLFAYRTTDDDWSIDWGFVGNTQFGVSLRDPAVGSSTGSNGFEVESYQAAETADITPVVAINGYTQTAPTFANISNFAFNTTPTTGLYQAGMYLQRNTAINIYNSLFYGYPEGLHLAGSTVGSTANLTSGTLDLKGIVLANVLTPIVGAGAITTDLATAYFTTSTRSNQIVQSSDLASLLLRGETFSLSAPNFLPQTGSPLLSGAVKTDKVAHSFFTAVDYRGAFGTDNWTNGWTDTNPQAKDYDR